MRIIIIIIIIIHAMVEASVVFVTFIKQDTVVIIYRYNRLVMWTRVLGVCIG